MTAAPAHPFARAVIQARYRRCVPARALRRRAAQHSRAHGGPLSGRAALLPARRTAPLRDAIRTAGARARRGGDSAAAARVLRA
jgi:hypothetical protein